MDHNNKEWVKRSTRLIPAIMIHIPLLLAATTTNNYKSTEFSSCDYLTPTRLTQSPKDFTHTSHV